jgi:toxin CptA
MKKAILSSEIDLRLQPSYLLWGWWCLFSMLVVACLWWKLPVGWAVSGTGLYCIVSVWQWTKLVATSHQQSLQAVRVNVYGQMTVMNRMGQVFYADVLPDSVVHPWCMVLHLELRPLQEEADAAFLSRKERFLVLPDQADRKSLAALRVWLRWGQA